MPKKYVKRVRSGRRRLRRIGGRRRLYRKKNYVSSNHIVAKFGSKLPIPRRYTCKLHYSDSITMSGAGSYQSVDQVFRMNSMFDPDLSLTGHQPRYFDQFSTLYGYYRVTGSKITVRYLPNDGTSPAQNTYLAVIASDAGASLTNSPYLDINELPLSKLKIGNIYGTRQVVSMYQPVHRVAGVAPSIVRNDDAWSAPTTGNPVNSSYWHVVVGQMNSTTLTWSGRLLVDIDYYVTFETPTVVSSS